MIKTLKTILIEINLNNEQNSEKINLNDTLPDIFINNKTNNNYILSSISTKIFGTIIEIKNNSVLENKTGSTLIKTENNQILPEKTQILFSINLLLLAK